MLASTTRAAARPKLSLAVPALANTATSSSKRPSLSLAVPAPRSPLPPLRAASTVKSSKKTKRVAFREETEIKCVTPLPEECYGAFVKMGREERKWARAAAAYD